MFTSYEDNVAGGGVPSVLQEVQVPVIENSVCQEMFHTAGHSKNIINSFLCAGYANGQRDSCEVSFDKSTEFSNLHFNQFF